MVIILCLFGFFCCRKMKGGDDDEVQNESLDCFRGVVCCVLSKIKEKIKMNFNNESNGNESKSDEFGQLNLNDWQ